MANIKINETSLALSESMETYLITIARLRVDDQPVPLSQLAEVLSISPVSVNEMCRKLQDQGFALYQPYKGVLLTPEGEKRAFYTLRRHRLWEVFLVQKLKFNFVEAHEAACQLEHSTPNLVADRLEVYLDYPATNPEGEPIPRANGRGILAGVQGRLCHGPLVLGSAAIVIEPHCEDAIIGFHIGLLRRRISLHIRLSHQ